MNINIKPKPKARWLLLSLTLLSVSFATSGCSPEQAPAAMNTRSSKAFQGNGSTLSRLFWQDRESGMIHAADLKSAKGGFEISKMQIANLEKLDTEQCDHVQMQIFRGCLIVGVRDHADGTEHSGWVEIDSGVEEESHGDHSHWHYDREPRLESSTLDTKQGNPAHVYRYGSRVFIANDKKNGFTMIQPKIGSSGVKFFEGGGGHITMAAVANKIAYSTWIDRKGEHAGQVDVIDLKGEDEKPKYSFHLPTGGIHGATACGNRVFFAPSKGVCWVDCDFNFTKTAESVDVHELSLEGDEDEGYRTGAFATFRNHVLCIANCQGSAPAVCVIDGTTPSPSVQRFLCENIEDGLKLSTIKPVSVGGHPFAVAFAEGEGVPEKLLVFDLDSNRDRKLGDIKLEKEIGVGKSKLSGHFGHHGIAFLQDQPKGVISNPGDGTLSVLDLETWTIVETFDVGGEPTHVVSYGGNP